MNSIPTTVLCTLLLPLSGLWAQEPPARPALAWAAPSQRYDAKRGETNAHFVFQFANTSRQEVVVNAFHPTCKCTVPLLPAPLPWRIAPDETGRLEVNVDLRERPQSFKQTIAVETSAGTNDLRLEINLAEPTPREKNRLAAFADRQAVFKRECANCHLHPAVGQSIALQYETLCGICHDASDRAEMVPDLASVKVLQDKAYWDQWVRRGKPGTFMPAFGKRFGGPLNDAQIGALIDYLATRYPPKPASEGR